MLKLLIYFLLCAVVFSVPNLATAKENTSFVSIVNPIRGEDFWDQTQDQTVVVKGQLDVLKKTNLPATWLVRPDALKKQSIVDILKNLPPGHEVGLFLEITPTWAKTAGVNYRQSATWHSAGSIFLTGYTQEERRKLIDNALSDFKEVFAVYPISVGAWWIDSHSLSYMQSKYGIKGALIVADQYSTDNYQIWGQYWGTPFYPAKTNALNPAQSIENKLSVVMMQWATRDPIGGFGKGVEESTLSVQPNDYIDYHDLGIDYFEKLIDVYTNQKLNSFNQIVVGLENSYPWDRYSLEYTKEIESLLAKQKFGQLKVATMGEFANWYIEKFPGLPPAHIIVADDPLGSSKKAVWFMNPFYRAGWLYSGNDVIFRDIRQYIDGSEEMCFSSPCKEVNFATFATRVLDEVTLGKRLLLDEGKISNFDTYKDQDKFVISYVSETGKHKLVEFLPRDISIDGKISSIDSTILQATTVNNNGVNQGTDLKGKGEYSKLNLVLFSVKFLIFVLLVLLIPGFVILSLVNIDERSNTMRIFISICIGVSLLTLISYTGLFFKAWWIALPYVLLMIIVFLFKRLYIDFKFSLRKIEFLPVILVIAGTIFQTIPTIRSGLLYDVGMGFWGPNAHDGIWHIALVNQMLAGLPPLNPIFSGAYLYNYHYFYDLLIAVTSKYTTIPIIDLIFRFYPVLFSLGLGVGTYYLSMAIFKSKKISLVGIYLVYFAGSFGWIVEYLREKHIGGESAFWSNQPVSFNLNPPFAISLVLLIAIVYLLKGLENKNNKLLLLLGLMFGSLIEFKAYAAVVGFCALGVVAIVQLIFSRKINYLLVLLAAGSLSLVLLIPNFRAGNLFVFDPFWFVHSMIDSPDRVGWVRLSLARMVGLESHNWFKFLAAESLGLVIFLGGNLGVRIFSLGVLIKSKKIAENTQSQFLLVLTLAAIIIPLLFVQAGNPWNSIQFMYYSLYTTAICAAAVLAYMFDRWRMLGKVVVVILLLIAPINAFVTANSYLYYLPHTSLAKQEVEGLTFLASKPDGVVLTVPFNTGLRAAGVIPIPLLAYETTAYVSAFSLKQTYIEDEIQQDILQTNYQDKLVKAKNFFNGATPEWSDEFLKKNNIRYIYLPKIYNKSIDSVSLKKIFENSKVKIYEFKG